MIPDLIGKGKRRRTVPVPAAVKVRIEEWVLAADIYKGRLFRPVTKGGELAGESLSDEKAIWYIVLKYAKATSLGKLSPRSAADLREAVPQGRWRSRADSTATGACVDPDHRALSGHRAEPNLGRQ